MGIALSQELKNNEFWNALGTVELTMGLANWLAQGNKAELVGTGKPDTTSYNNGMTVVYDEKGHPWVRSSKLVDQDWYEKIKRTYRLQPGAYVPHSNDGGEWKNQMGRECNVQI